MDWFFRWLVVLWLFWCGCDAGLKALSVLFCRRSIEVGGSWMSCDGGAVVDESLCRWGVDGGW